MTGTEWVKDHRWCRADRKAAFAMDDRIRELEVELAAYRAAANAMNGARLLAEAEVERLEDELRDHALYEKTGSGWYCYYEQGQGRGRDSGEAIPPEGESGTVSPPTGRTASAAANPAAREEARP